MSKYKIGITEAGDAGVDLSWENKLDSVDAAILITKNITPRFSEAALRHKEKLIVHATVTGYGGTVLEPNVPHWSEQLSNLNQLVSSGFPINRTVVRVDPIIPTQKGCAVAASVMEEAMKCGYSRFRISLIDMYPHVRKRFAEAGLPLPYGDSFSPGNKEIELANKLILNMFSIRKSLVDLFMKVAPSPPLVIEACAEPKLIHAIQRGCVSSFDLELLGLSPDKDGEGAGYQRKNCLCYAGKKELLSAREPCAHRCLYCYWKQD